MSAITADQTPTGTRDRLEPLARRVWMSRAMMALFYLATLAGLIVVSGAGPDPTVADEVIDPITVAARHPVETVGGVDLVEQD